MPRRLFALSTLTLLLSGCAFHHAQPAVTDVIPPAKMKLKLAADRDRLAGPDSPERVRHTYLGIDTTGDGPFTLIRKVTLAVPGQLYARFNGITPVKYAAEMEDAKTPDHRREGMLKLANYRFARTNPIYARRFDQIASEPGIDPTVKAAAIRAMNHSRDKLHEQTFVDNVDDADFLVRLEAVKALANLPDEKAVSKLIAHLQRDDNKDVRIACADALREYKTAEVARALIAVLPERDFGVAFRARESLILMTGRNFRFDEVAWLSYFASSTKPFI